MIIETEHPTARKLKSIGVSLKFSETKVKPSWAVPILGGRYGGYFERIGKMIIKSEWRTKNTELRIKVLLQSTFLAVAVAVLHSF